MSGHKQSLTFKVYVFVVCTAWFAVVVGALWGLDWRWIPTAFVAAVVLLLAGGMVENWAHERGSLRAVQRAHERAVIAAEEEAWLGGQDQPR